MGSRNALFVGMVASSLAAFAISYSTAWSVRVASSTTYSMVGALNKLPVALSGILFFPRERHVVNGGNIVSVMIGMLCIDEPHNSVCSICERCCIQCGSNSAA